MTDTPAIQLDGVSKAYDKADAPALHQTDLEIGQGEFFSLLGPSGSGKTTTLRLIAGFERTDSGRVVVDGVDVTHVPPFRRNVCTVFQNYALFPHLDVARNLAFPLEMLGVGRSEIRKRTAEALEQIDLADLGHRLPRQLSGGQQQRVALARALISQPRVLLLDEPLGALDLRLRQQMQVVLRDLQRRVGITFVYVTHDQGEALSLSDRLAVMNRGRIEQIGTPREAYYRPTTRFAASFVGKSNILACTIEGGLRARAGELVLELPPGTGEGGSAVAIRYEALRVVVPGDDAVNRLPATVRETTFLGDSQEVEVEACGHRLMLKTSGAGDSAPQAGTAIHIAVAPEDIVVLRDP